MKLGRKSANGTLFALAGGFLLLVLFLPANGQTHKKAVKPALPQTAHIVSEDGVPDPAKATERKVDVASNTGGAYRTSLQDLVTVRETELAAVVAQQSKLEELARDGLISRKVLDDAADGIVEARARLEDARRRLASIDSYAGDDMASGDTVDDDTASTAVPAMEKPAAEVKPLLKKTTVVYPRRKAAAKRKTH